MDVRILAATNKDLKKEFEEGRFREDLYHRLSVILIKVPALKSRTEDIPALASHFLQSIAKEQGTKPKTATKEVFEYLKTLPWTGNIRELKNVIERLIILSGDIIVLEDSKKYT